MRIIAGKARRLNLKTLEGLQVRPTTDRIKETLFNIIQNDIAGCNFLDLFSGSGAIGLEAASRDAKMVYLVESSSKAQSIIEENIAHTKLYDNTKLIKRDFRVAISELSKKISFDIIFADPPYKDKLELLCGYYLNDKDINLAFNITSFNFDAVGIRGKYILTNNVLKTTNNNETKTIIKSNLLT